MNWIGNNFNQSRPFSAINIFVSLESHLGRVSKSKKKSHLKFMCMFVRPMSERDTFMIVCALENNLLGRCETPRVYFLLNEWLTEQISLWHMRLFCDCCYLLWTLIPSARRQFKLPKIECVCDRMAKKKYWFGKLYFLFVDRFWLLLFLYNSYDSISRKNLIETFIYRSLNHWIFFFCITILLNFLSKYEVKSILSDFFYIFFVTKIKKYINVIFLSRYSINKCLCQQNDGKYVFLSDLYRYKV